MKNKNSLFDRDEWDLQDPVKRRLVMQLLVFGAAGSLGDPAQAFWGKKTKKIADDRSIFTLTGDVRVNGDMADKSTRIYAGDTVSTGEKSEIIFAVGGDSFILRDNSELEIAGAGFFIRSLRMVTGRMLSVFGKRKADQRLDMSASTATIGIRGSGVYLESEPGLAYVCTCYGLVALAASDDPNDSEMISTSNHESPRYIDSNPSRGSRIRPAPVIRHTNTELRLLENIVGRDVPKHLRKAYIKY